MTRTITLSGDESLLRMAREKALREPRSLNNLLRGWLECYVSADGDAARYAQLMQLLSYVDPGKHFTRDELNER